MNKEPSGVQRNIGHFAPKLFMLNAVINTSTNNFGREDSVTNRMYSDIFPGIYSWTTTEVDPFFILCRQSLHRMPSSLLVFARLSSPQNRAPAE